MTLNPVASWVHSFKLARLVGASYYGSYRVPGTAGTMSYAFFAAAALTEHGMFSADEVNFVGLAAAGATLLSPFPGEGRLGVKVGLRARAAQ